MLAGEMWTYSEDNFRERMVSCPGDMAYLRRHQAKGFKLREGTWMLEYGRGAIPTALPFALSDAVVGLDLPTIAKTFWRYGRLVVKELWRGKI
jgi:C-8 sterol isomerase